MAGTGSVPGFPGLLLPGQGSEGCVGGLAVGKRDVGQAGHGVAVTQRQEPWPHALQLPARSHWAPSTASRHRPCLQHPQAAESLLGWPLRHQSFPWGTAWHSHGPPSVLCQHPRSSCMGGPDDLALRIPDTAPRTQDKSPAQQQWWGRACLAGPAPLSHPKSN